MVNLTVKVMYVNLFAGCVLFSCWDDEQTEIVAFESSIDTAHACFLAEHELKNDFSSAYGQLIYAINNDGLEKLTVGQTFTS